MQRSFRGARAFALSTLTAAVLSVTSTATVAGPTTTLGTRGSLSRANQPIDTNANATWKNYTRAADYADAITLPVQFITTQKGLKLAVLVSVPADAKGKQVAGQFPVVLTQTAYRVDLGQLLGTFFVSGNTLLIGGKDEFMIRRGYISVAVDVVGSGMSDGSAALLGEAEQEGYAEAVEWVTKQPWFNGNLGLAGTSYLGITSLQTASQQHPAVKAVFVQVPMGDSFRGTVGVGGLLNGLFISNWLPLTQMLSVQNSGAIKNNPTYAAQIKAANQQHIDAINDWYLPTVTNSLAGMTGYATDDGNFWSVRSPIEKVARIKVPTFIVGADNDIFQRDEPLIYEQLKNNVNTKLLVLPGAHVQSVLAAQSNANTTSEKGAPPTKELMLQWFDQYLKGMNSGAAAQPNVTQYVKGFGALGGDRYASTTDWPHPQTTTQRMYLRGDMSLSTQAPSGDEPSHTVAEPAAPTVSFSVSSDGTTVKGSVKVADGSDCSSSYVQWTLGIGGLLPKACFENSNTVEREQKALIFQTAPMAADMYINGPMQADIWMSATQSEAAVAVRIDVVDAWGKATPISTGLMSAAFRAVDPARSRYIDGVMIQPWHPFTVASKLPVVAGQPMLVPVEVFPAAALVKKGQRLRVAISASNQAQGIWSTPQQQAANGNISTIYNDPSRPSSVVLPLVPVSALK
jgi:putative CocE/NonD family hydrolase